MHQEQNAKKAREVGDNIPISTSKWPRSTRDLNKEVEHQEAPRDEDLLLNVLDIVAIMILLVMFSTVTFDFLEKNGTGRNCDSLVFVKSVSFASNENHEFNINSASVCSFLKRRSFAARTSLFPEDQYQLFLSSMLRNRSGIGSYGSRSYTAFSNVTIDLDSGMFIIIYS